MGGKAAADYSFPHNAALADLLEAVVLEVDILIEVEGVTRIRTAQLFVQEAQVRVELFEARIVVGDDLGEEGVEAAEGFHAGAATLWRNRGGEVQVALGCTRREPYATSPAESRRQPKLAAAPATL